jgi:uncharacterized protein
VNIVLDTNVLVSGLLAARGTPAAILDEVMAGRISVLYDAAISIEYRAVLARPKFAIPDALREAVLLQLEFHGRLIPAGVCAVRLPHQDDEKFLQVALRGAADCLVTGNLRHFPDAACRGVRVSSPAEFLKQYRQKETG